MAHPYWPLFDLVVRTPRLELRPPDDDMLAELASGSADVFSPDEMHFVSDWTLQPSPTRERESLQWWWRTRAEFSPNSWSLCLAVVVDGKSVGVQDVMAKNFPALRSVLTGSWLRRTHQGRGLGKEMRAAALHLAFDGLGALEAHSGAFETNPSSIGVSRSVGYEDNGEELALRGGTTATREIRFRMSRERFAERRRDDIVIENLQPCLPTFGLGPDLEPIEAPPRVTYSP
jgi:RimJ/RimL family protein N-acetyltransferase